MKELLQNLAMAMVDKTMAVIPRSLPDEAALRNCKIISHRGEHDNRTVMENTLLAFDNARTVGVWGLECDIRWTSDDVPVICHDATTSRVFEADIEIARVSFSQLREALPDVPSLEELVNRFGGNTHLMLELKSYDSNRLERQRRVLAQVLNVLTPEEDYHFLALEPALFTLADFVAPSALLPVAQTNVRELSKISLQRGYCGLSGHYLLLGKALKQQHEAAGQRLGTGFPRSRNCLYRELGRGIEWIFSNDAVYLQGLLNELRAAGRF